MEHGTLAVRAAFRAVADDAALRCCALAAYGLMHFNTGRGIPTAEMEQALSLERSLTDWPLDDESKRGSPHGSCAGRRISTARAVSLQEVLPIRPCRGTQPPLSRGGGALVSEPARDESRQLGRG